MPVIWKYFFFKNVVENSKCLYPPLRLPTALNTVPSKETVNRVHSSETMSRSPRASQCLQGPLAAACSVGTLIIITP